MLLFHHNTMPATGMATPDTLTPLFLELRTRLKEEDYKGAIQACDKSTCFHFWWNIRMMKICSSSILVAGASRYWKKQSLHADDTTNEIASFVRFYLCE